MATITDTDGIEPIRTVIHRVLVDNEPFRTVTNGLELCTVDGIRIGTAATWFLDELNAQNDAETGVSESCSECSDVQALCSRRNRYAPMCRTCT